MKEDEWQNEHGAPDPRPQTLTAEDKREHKQILVLLEDEREGN